MNWWQEIVREAKEAVPGTGFLLPLRGKKAKVVYEPFSRADHRARAGRMRVLHGRRGRVIERSVAFANVYAGGTSAPDIVVFAREGDKSLLGARALEGLNLRVDVLRKELVSAGPVSAAGAWAA